MKRCSKCGEDKNISEFPSRHERSRSRETLKSECGACRSVHNKKWRYEHREEISSYRKKYYQEHKEEYRARARKYREAHLEELKAYDKKRRHENPARMNAERAWWLKRKHGLTVSEYEAMFESQRGICAICGDHGPSQKRLHVDHDHSTGAIRGLLCSSCNLAIGKFKDNPEIMRAAAEYIEQSARPKKAGEAI